MNKNYQIKITQMAIGGEGVASLEGKKLFVPFAVTGDELEVKIIEDKKDYARAQIVKILHPSAHRVQPSCSYFYRCGGCQWQQLSYEAQLQFKNELLIESLKRVAKISEPKVLNPLAAPQPFHYRNRIRLQVSQKFQLGFYKASSREIIPIERCEIAQNEINEKISQAQSLVLEHGKKIKNFPFELEIEAEGKPRILAEQNETQFSQINSAQNKVLKQKVIEYLNLNRQHQVLELFAGAGNFSFDLAVKAGQVLAIENNEQAVERARERAKKSHVKNIEFIQASSARALYDLLRAGKHFDKLLLDPPRAGAEDCLDKISRMNIPEILYVSCDPATLSRDVKQLMQLGYKHQFSQLIDMFPQTYHIESINYLVK